VNFLLNAAHKRLLTAHSELLFSAVSLQYRQLQLSVQAGTVREEREREQE
jgi:hypothetical protein